MSGAPGRTMVSLSGLGKRFGTHAALSEIDLQIGEAEIVAVIGPSGSGKSTLLRCINLLEAPTEGRIEIDGELILDLPPGAKEPHYTVLDDAAARARRKSAMVFQRFNLFPHLRVRENVSIGLVKVQRKPQAEARRVAEALLTDVGLADKLEAWPAELSGGQQQRVAIARAVALNPRILLFDEPTSALDPELVGEVLRVIKGLASNRITKIIVTHEMAFARAAAHRVVVMDHGRIVETGPPEQIFTAPKNPRTQAFLQRLLERETGL